MANRAGSISIEEFELANSLESQDQFVFFQNSTRKTKRVTRNAMFASAGVSTELAPVVSGLESYTLTGDPFFLQYSGFVDQKRQFLEQATGLLQVATGLLADSGAQIREDLIDLNIAFTGASGVLRSSIDTNYIVATGISGTLAARIETLNSEFTGTAASLSSTIQDVSLTVTTASGTLAQTINNLNSTFTGATGSLSSNIQEVNLTVTTASGTLASRIDTLNSEFTGASGSLSATISGNYETFVNASGALATAIDVLNSTFTGATGSLSATIASNYETFTNASGALASRIDSTEAYASGISGSVVQETSARISSVSGVSGAVALNWGVKLNGDSGVIGAIKMVGDGVTSNFLVITDNFKVQNVAKTTPAGAASSQVTLLDIKSNGIVFGADILSDNYSEGVSGWRVKRSTGDAEFNDVTVRGQIKGGTTLGDSGDTEFGLVVNSQFGIRRSVNNGSLILTGGSGNGVFYGAQIDMIGSDYAGESSNAQGQLNLSAGYKSSMDTLGSDGAIIFRTSREYQNQNIGAVRLMIEIDGTVKIVETPTGNTAGYVYPGAPNGGAGTLVVDKSVTAQTYTSTSSKRFKKKIKNLKNGMEIVNKLRPVTFDWKTKDLKNDIGLIAEEVNEVVPNIVGLNNKGEVVGLDYGKLTPILIQAIKELSLEVSKLKNKIK